MTLPRKAKRTKRRGTSLMRPHAGNARLHDGAQRAQIMASMQAFGFPISSRSDLGQPRHLRRISIIPNALRHWQARENFRT